MVSLSPFVLLSLRRTLGCLLALPPQHNPAARLALFVTFNGSSFDLPVLRYRAMVNSVSAPGLAMRPYFHRYTDDAVDLCDALSSFSSQARATNKRYVVSWGYPESQTISLAAKSKDITAKDGFGRLPSMRKRRRPCESERMRRDRMVWMGGGFQCLTIYRIQI